MAFREVRVFEVREVLRLWLRGEGVRATERLVGVDRKTVRRYLAAAQELGLVGDGGEEQLSDEFMGSVVEKVRPHRVDGRGRAWALLVSQHAQIETWLKTEQLTVVKVLGRDRARTRHHQTSSPTALRPPHQHPTAAAKRPPA